MGSVAETEIAIWSFYQLTEGALKDNGSAVAAAQFYADVWIQRRRLRHALRPFLQRYGQLEFARLLCDEDANLAGKIAGEEYERMLRNIAQSLYPQIRLAKDWARVLIERLGNDGYVDLKEKPMLQRVWEIRNDAVHATAKPRAEEVELMIDCIERICVPLRSKSMAKRTGK